MELGCADITVEASMMASFMVAPRQGHLNQLYHIFAYLKNKHNCEMVFNPTEPDINTSDFQLEDWSCSVYNGVQEKVPTNAPTPCGRGFILRAYVDSDHAGQENTRRSRTGFIIFLNNAPIYWTSKKHGSTDKFLWV